MNKKDTDKATKTIYYAFKQKVDVPQDMTDDQIENMIREMCQTSYGSIDDDYMWSDTDNLFEWTYI